LITCRPASGAGWTWVATSTAYRSTTTNSRSVGAQLRLSNARVRRLALVVTMCSHCGSVAIYLNGTYWRSVNTYSTTTGLLHELVTV
jgi:hypothetical protein